MAAEISTLGRLAISPVVAQGSTPSTCDFRLNFGGFSKGVSEVKADSNQTRGELARRLNRVRTSQIHVSPNLDIQPTAAELARILDWALGAAPSGTTYALGNTCRRARLMYDDNTSVWDFAEVAVGRITLRSSDSDPTLHTNLALLAKNCTSGATWPAGLASSIVDETTQPFIHQDTSTAVLLNGSAVMTPNVEIDIDNGILGDRFFNSLYLTEFVKPDRHITLNLTFPFGEYPTLWNTAAGDSGITVAITYTNGGTSLLFTFPAVQFKKDPIAIPMRGEVMHQLSGIAYRTTSTEELVITLDSTP